jgi:hypothetical protein
MGVFSSVRSWRKANCCMKVSPEVLDWVRKAESDLAAAYRLATGEPPLLDQMGFFCQ